MIVADDQMTNEDEATGGEFSQFPLSLPRSTPPSVIINLAP